MTPEQFVHKWKLSTLGERQAAQPHFLELCEVLGQPKPGDPGAEGEADYCFEKGATRTGGRRGWADVWRRGRFAWEYKGKGANLEAALSQLQQYALALENPPLLVVCDLERFLIVTNWTNTVSRRISLRIEDLLDPAKRETLVHVFADPERLKPGLTREQVTAERALSLAGLARDLRARGNRPEPVARFLVRLVFCMFAQSIGLLPANMLTRMLEEAERAPEDSADLAEALFRAMASGGRLGLERVRWFDGGLFEAAEGESLALGMDRPQLRDALRVARSDWSEIDPSVMGTLFVQSLDPKRLDDLFRRAGTGDLGASTFRRSFEQYTDRDKIMRIVDPVVRRPLEAEWDQARARIEALLHPDDGRAPAPRARAEAEALYKAHLDRLRAFRVLDPACGSGNFLFLALQTLKDLEWRAILDGGQLGLHPEIPQVDPRAVLGIDVNGFAVEIARAAVWIGHLQWYRRQGLQITGEPVLQPLDTIERRDALVKEDGTEAAWPEADVIVGNPPFLGVKLMYGSLGRDYTETIRAAYPELSRFSDLVCFWFEKARQQLDVGKVRRVGLVATNSIRGGRNRLVLDRIAQKATIYDAWSDEPWTVDGAAVRVSLVCFGSDQTEVRLNGRNAEAINPDLTPQSTTVKTADLTQAQRLQQNVRVGFVGTVKGGSFEISGDTARKWLRHPVNPNGRPNSDVLRPWFNGLDVIRRPRDIWIVDFGTELPLSEAVLYEAPFEHVRQHVKPHRDQVRNPREIRQWWLFSRALPSLRAALVNINRFIATPVLSKYRVFVWMDARQHPDHQLMIVARDDDTAFGLLHSRLHELWSLRLGTSLEDRPRYTPSTTFETFPFPEGFTPNLPASAYADDPRAARIAEAARRLDGLRGVWLNPPDLVERKPEVVPGYPDRLVPRDAAAAAELKKRTLTNLYNARPQWLSDAHAALDEAVAAAYGWPADLPDEEVLARLLALNLERAAAGR